MYVYSIASLHKKHKLAVSLCRWIEFYTKVDLYFRSTTIFSGASRVKTHRASAWVGRHLIPRDHVSPGGREARHLATVAAVDVVGERAQAWGAGHSSVVKRPAVCGQCNGNALCKLQVHGVFISTRRWASRPKFSSEHSQAYISTCKTYHIYTLCFVCIHI